jgi:exodeoxyribonuclease VII small subunit
MSSVEEEQMGKLEDLSFEAAFAELEEVVRRLEEGNLPLDEAMAFFERGTALAAHCNTRLDAAELRVQQLVPAPDGEDYDLAPFGESSPDE